MIHYHGLPITPGSAARMAVNCGHAFVSFRYPEQLGLALEVCQSFAVDNGAFSAWKSGKPITDWHPYYLWVERVHRYPSFDFAVIPDVVDGGEYENDRLIDEWPFQSPKQKWVGAPVWHLHESLSRLKRLAEEWPRVCLGSSGAFSTVGTSNWWGKIRGAMEIVCDENFLPLCKLHGLRMLNTRIFTKMPLSSADSTNIGRNVGIDSKWRGTYTPPNKDIRAVVMRERIEAHQSSIIWRNNGH